MVGHDLVAEALALHRRGVVADELRQPRDDRLEEIGLVVRLHPLDDRCQPLEAGAGVDALERQRGQRAVSGPVVLHEHQVADLEPSRAVLGVVGNAVRALRQMRTPVVVELAARAARAGVAHLPEVLLVAGRDVPPAHDPLGRQADLIGPDRVRLVVIGVDGGRQARRVDPELAGQELPVPVDRLALEVVAERPVSEHLEEGVVARGAPTSSKSLCFPATRRQTCASTART